VLEIEGLVLLPLARQEIEQRALGWLTRDISRFEGDLPRDRVIMLQEGLVNSFTGLGTFQLPKSLLGTCGNFRIPIPTGRKQRRNHLRPGAWVGC
jgi:hypothetical protein